MQNADFPWAKVIDLHRRFREAAIPHAFGGALALAFYAEPRETSDIDVNVFVPVERRQGVDEALASLGTDAEHPIHLSPEHLVVRKTILDRPKDRRDIEAILAHTSVDQAEVDDWVRRLRV